MREGLFCDKIYKTFVCKSLKRVWHMIEVVVVGAGASGMAAALSTVMNNNNNVKVTILEHGQEAGKKLLVTGNGRCNLTNRKLNEECFRSHDDDRIGRWLQNSDTQSIVDFFGKLGMMCTEKNGYLYPYSYQASTVRDTLVSACAEKGVDILTDCHVMGISKKCDGKFELLVSQGYIDEKGERKKRRVSYNADKIVLACGSKAYPKLGSDGSGYVIAKELGFKMFPVVPALTGLKCREGIYRLASGVRTQANIDLFVDHERMASDRGEIQLTDYGISGIPVFQVSRYASYGLAEGCKVHGVIDFMPEYTEAQVREILDMNMLNHAGKNIYEILCGMLNSKLVNMILAYCRIDGEIKPSEMNDVNKKDIVQAVKSFYTVITGTNDYDQSQVCAGGISLSELDDDFQSIRIPGIFIVGEILDVDGICGGYNLHWAWLSGMTAGKNIGK